MTPARRVLTFPENDEQDAVTTDQHDTQNAGDEP